VVGVVTLIVGFAGCVLSRVVGGEQLGMAQGLLLGGLAVFGVGMGIVYSGAIYYAMEVGSAQVEAGGTHEALIGVGYTLGPALALVAALGVERGMLSDIQGDGAVMALVGAATLLIAVYVVRRVRTMTAKTP
jgi:MFS family permease